MLSKPPYFPLYVDDLENDGKVVVMTTEQFGAYIYLLCKAWKEEPAGSVPDDDAILSRWARLSAKRWASIKKPVMAAFHKRADGRWYQKRLRATYEEVMSKVRKRSERAKVGSSKRWHKDSNAEAQAEHKHGISIIPAFGFGSVSESESLHLGKEGSGGKGTSPQSTASLPPAAQLAQQWLFFLKGPRSKATEFNAVAEVMAELLRKGTPQADIDARIADKSRDWSEPIWDFKNHWSKPKGKPPPPAAGSGITAGIQKLRELEKAQQGAT